MGERPALKTYQSSAHTSPLQYKEKELAIVVTSVINFIVIELCNIPLDNYTDIT